MVGRFDLATGEASAVLTREDGSTAEQPRISSDETEVVYVRFIDIYNDSAGSAIFIADVEGGPERRLTDWELFGAHPDWTADRRMFLSVWVLPFGVIGASTGNAWQRRRRARKVPDLGPQLEGRTILL